MKKLLFIFLALWVSSAMAQVSPETKAGSVVVGVPTGGNCGAGCVNAQAIQINGSPVTGGGIGTVTGTSGVTVSPTTGSPVVSLSPIAGNNVLCVQFGAGPASPGPCPNIPMWYHVCTACSRTVFSTAATTNTVTLFTLPAGGIVHAIKIKHSTAFAGTSITAYTISVGISTNTQLFASAFDVFQATGGGVLQLSPQLQEVSDTATTTVTATATSTGANLSAATAGVVDIWALVSVSAGF